MVELWAASVIDSGDHNRHSERARSASLREALHDASDVLGNVVDARSFVVGESVALGFDSRVVHYDSRIGIETGEGGADVVVNQGDLLERARMLQFLESLFLNSEDHVFFGSQADSTVTLISSPF